MAMVRVGSCDGMSSITFAGRLAGLLGFMHRFGVGDCVDFLCCCLYSGANVDASVTVVHLLLFGSLLTV